MPRRYCIVPRKHFGVSELDPYHDQGPEFHDNGPKRVMTHSVSAAESEKIWVFTRYPGTEKNIDDVIRRRVAPAGVVAVSAKARIFRSVTPT